MLDLLGHLIEKLAPAPHDGSPNWKALFLCVLIVALVVYVIREVICWLLKTSAIVANIERANSQVREVKDCLDECKKELQKANKSLEKIAPRTGAGASPGGDTPCR